MLLSCKWKKSPMGLEYCTYSIHFGPLPHYTLSSKNYKESTEEQVLKANWLCPLGFAGDLGKGPEGETVTCDGHSHRSCLGQKKEFKVQCVICFLSAQPRAGFHSARGEGCKPAWSHYLLNESYWPDFWKPSHIKLRPKLCFTWALASQKQLEKRNSKITPSEEALESEAKAFLCHRM